MTQLASPALSLPVRRILLVTVQSWPLRFWVCEQKSNKNNNTATHASTNATEGKTKIGEGTLFCLSRKIYL